MRRKTGVRQFPPPLGWIPIGVALLAVAAMSFFAIAPQFGQPLVKTEVAGGGAGNGSADPQASGAANGTGPGANNGNGGNGPGGAAANGANCGAGKNGGATAPGVTATQIHVASTVVKSGVGAGFLGEAEYGMRAAINEVNSSGGVCGRTIALDTVNTGWDGPTGKQDIDNYINSGSVFALVGEPDSEGLDQAIKSGSIDRGQIPVVGTDGMLKSQYHNPWVWPVAASTVTNMHIIAKDAVDHGAKTFGIVFDTSYKFGSEGQTPSTRRSSA